MITHILAILLDIGIIFAAGIWLCWIGIMPMTIGPEKLPVPSDSGLNWFRIFARVMGPIIILATSWQMVRDVRHMVRPQALAWQNFTSAEGRFEVELPAEPEHSNSDIRVLETPVTEYKFKAEASDPYISFLVGYLDCPPAINNLEPRAFLDGEFESRVQTAKVRLIKKSAATVDGCPALYFSMDTMQQGICVEGYLVLDHTRLYQLGVQYADDRTESSRQRFLDSFRVVRKY